MNDVLSRGFSLERTGLDPYSTSNRVAKDRLRSAGMLILVLILVVTGSYVRTRTVSEGDSADWLVILQLGMSFVGGCLGALLIQRHSLGGFGAKVWLVYLLAVFASGLFSSYPALVFGYWFLLAGTSLLCIGLVSSSPTEDSLRGVEKLILATLSFMLLKDAMLDAFVFAPQVERMDELGIEMYRFGMGSTSSNSMGLIAAMAFWMSFRTSSEGTGSSLAKTFWRGLFAAIVLLTRARIALAALLVGAIVRWWFSHRHSREIRSHILLVAVPCLVGGAVVFAAICWLWGAPLITDAIDLVNRGENSATMMSVTGRTDIWPYALHRVFDRSLSIVFGHGYGASKFVLNENNWTASFFAYHSHNTFLEVLLSTGLFGALPFAVLVVYSLKWLVRSFQVSQSFSSGFTLRAISVVSAILISTMTEADLAIKIGPIVIVYMFYVLSLDREAAFLRAAHLQRGYVN